ncbi:MAG: ATP-binding cassette domain-containing protein, partial [Mycobacteriales bacterium]
MSADTDAAQRTVQGLALLADNVTAGYGGNPIIHEVSIRVAPAEVVSIVGPNGSGKSTLLKSLVGIVEILSGTVTVGERDV